MEFRIFVFRTAFALFLGAFVGLERQWRQRTAGLRTNALVAVGAAFFATLAFKIEPVHGSQQILAYVISGVGFLGAGAILREGGSVRGLNTAATLWCAAAVGLLSGCGYYMEAGTAALMVIGAHLILRPIGRRLEQAPISPGEDLDCSYEVSVVCRSLDEQRIRTRLPGPCHAARLRCGRRSPCAAGARRNNRSRSTGSGGIGPGNPPGNPHGHPGRCASHGTVKCPAPPAPA